MVYSIILLICGFLKLLTGIDILSFAFLYLLIFKKRVDFRFLVLWILFAELFNNNVYGLYIVSFSLAALFFHIHRRFFHQNSILDFLFFIINFILIRLIANGGLLFAYDINVGYYFWNLMPKLFFVAVLFWSQYLTEKCLAKFIKFS